MLKPLSSFRGYRGPVVVIVMDGYGLSSSTVGNAIRAARKPTLDRLFAAYPNTSLLAHGKAVGMPSDEDMGNSEVGHNAIGAGQVYNQGAALVADAIRTGALFEGRAWREVMGQVKGSGGTLHLLGLFSDGNVHAHIDHLKALILRAKEEGQARVRVHILLDGRDVGETSALDYLRPFEAFLAELRGPGFDARIASGGGRMQVTMDRYEADWGMVERGWKAHVLAEGRAFKSAEEAISAFRLETPGIIDQNLPAFVVEEDGRPLGPILDGDSVVFFNFRGDRAIEISRAFLDEHLPFFDRKRLPKVCYAGMLQYDGDLQLPPRYLVAPPTIKDTLGEYLARDGVSQLAISETQKYGHVTYFWNGNRSGKFDDRIETYIEIPSDRVSFDTRPWMKSAEITDALIEELKTGRHRFARVNYANGDMVGHTGHFEASVQAIEAVDLCLSRLLPVIDALGGMAILTADHGNADEMYEIDKKTGNPLKDAEGRFKSKTSHTLNPVPCIFYDNQHAGAYDLETGPRYRLSNVAATAANLLGFEAPSYWDGSMIRMKS